MHTQLSSHCRKLVREVRLCRYPLSFASNFLAISYFMANSLDRFSARLFRRFDNLVVLP